MSRPMVRIYNEDGTFTDREMNDVELAQSKKDDAVIAAYQDSVIAKDAARASAVAKLAVLGLTADEVIAIVG